MLLLSRYLKTGTQLIVFLFLFKNINSQNLINNGSFENYTNPIDCSAGGFDNYNNTPVNHVVDSWYGLNSPDYFNNSCPSSSWYNAPNGIFGYCYPHQGNAHVGCTMFYKPSDTKEYIYQQLNTPLQAGKIYCLSFYVSRADRKEYAVHSIGAYFSNNIQSVGTIGYVNANPQVINQSGFITDTINWVQIQGCFTANGGEQYITIGNFNSNVNTDTLYTGTNNPIPFDTQYDYYYIDDITLIDQTTVGLKDVDNEKGFTLLPNPNNGVMQLNYSITKKSEFIITDITGRIINTYILDEVQQNFVINEDELNSGIYFYSVKQNNVLLKQDKFVVIK